MTLKTWFILVPCAVIALILTLANLEPVTFSFDPFSDVRPALAFELPLIAVVFVAFFLGMLAGGMAAWAGQGRNRREKREAKRELKRVHKIQKKEARESTDLVPADPSLAIAADPHAHRHGG